MKNKKTVFLTGATGVMGFETLKEFAKRLDRFNIRILARNSKKNRKKLKPFIQMDGIHVEWGDLMNIDDIRKGLGDSEYLLHIGGIVSPLADHIPQKTMEVNVGAMQNIIDVVKNHDNKDKIKVVYIGSVAQTSNRMPPYHWGRTGDPILAAKFDYYGISKIKAERLISESGIKHWVSLRQTGILHKGLISKATDPISFHVPLNGVLEWSTLEDSAKLMINLCDSDNLPDSFWRNYYNIGSGKEFRLTNYEFEKFLMSALGCPPPEKAFERNWFATRNFHGEWYEDSDKLNDLIPFREEISARDYFKRLAHSMPWWVKLAPIAPSPLIKGFMKKVAYSKDLGTLDWLRRNDCEDRIQAFFGSRDKQRAIKGWKEFDSTPPTQQAIHLSHGYDESKRDEDLTLEDMISAAKFRGGKCLSTQMKKGDLMTSLDWECGFGHKFSASPNTILKGGHWCEECTCNWNYEEQIKKNEFLAQFLKNQLEDQ